MVEEPKTSPADAPAPDESKADVPVADTASAKSTALVPAGDADDLTPEDEAELAEDTGAIQRGLNNIRATGVDIGERLAKQKAVLPHGKFLRWIEAKFDFTDQTARNLMNLAALAKSKPVLDLPIDLSGLYILAAPSTPEAAVDEAIETAKTEPVTKKTTKAIVAKHAEATPAKKSKPTSTKKKSEPTSKTGMQLAPTKTSEFRKRHAEALKRFKAVVANPPDDLLEKVRNIAAGMDSDYSRWPPNGSTI
jgi:hypothetical protein